MPDRIDPRVAAFCSGACPDLFHGVAHRHEVWRADPFDVGSIHEEARSAFERLVARATARPGPDSGRILLLRGESGCGKTHLMRAFRNWAHERGRAYCGYMQMTSATDRYARYVLNNLIDSLDRPYYESRGEATGLMRLSTAMVEAVASVPPELLARLREEELDWPALARVVDDVADLVALDDRYDRIDTDLVRALLYLQRDDPRVRGRVLKYLRCEYLSSSDRRALGDLVPRVYDDAPQWLVEKLGGLMAAAESAALVLCVDQLEEIRHQEGAEGRFRRAMATLCEVADRVPSSVVVVACLDNFYEDLRSGLTRSVIDRLEVDPAPIRLKSNRESGEVEEMIARRLEFLYETEEVAAGPEGGRTFPIPAAMVASMRGQRARDVLTRCQDYRERCIRSGRLVDDESGPGTDKPGGDEPGTTRVEQSWNDFRISRGWDVPDDDGRQFTLLTWAIERCSDELPEGVRFAVEGANLIANVERRGPGDEVRRLVVGLCNRSARGGGLKGQVSRVLARSSRKEPVVTPVVVRSSDFPPGTRTQVGQQLAELVARGGRRVVVEDTDWRTILALREFRRAHADDPDLAAWLRAERPLGQLRSLRTILGLDQVAVTPRAEPPRPSPPPAVEPRPGDGPASTPEAPPEVDVGPPETGPLHLGRAQGRAGGAVEMDPQELARHAAFLGGTGSGKTTLALSLVEQLVLRGVPALLVDRKGDLCGYADRDSAPDADEALRERARRLRERADVVLFTPGNPAGRPLSIAVAPEGLGRLPTFEREQVARYAAAALGGMMGYSSKGTDQARQAILACAIQVIGELQPDEPVAIEEVIRCVHEQEPALLAAAGLLDTKLFARLVQDLETLRLGRGTLLAAAGERLDVEALLGLGRYAVPGKTRLGIVSTKFLGGNPDVQFWVAQLLIELGRWASRSPSARLQAVVLFDEADLYLPATRQPATKEPMENLLRRARSAGLGVLLATQSPGDLDYKCRDNIRSWLVGRVREATALAKMRPMLAGCRVDVASRLPTQGPGEFHLLREGEVVGLLAARNAVPPVQRTEDEILGLARGTAR